MWAICQPGTLEDVLIEIVNLGGDADTTGRWPAGSSASVTGSQAIPARWVDRLEYRDRIRADPEGVADLLGRGSSPTPLDPKPLAARLGDVWRRPGWTYNGGTRWHARHASRVDESGSGRVAQGMFGRRPCSGWRRLDRGRSGFVR